MTPEPLQPGTYSFNTLSSLTDQNGNPVTPLALSFTISNPPDGQIALTTHQTMSVPGATPLPMTRSARDSPRRWAWGRSPAPAT